MPSAAPGSENPRGKTAPKAPSGGPKRTPRPDSTNGKSKGGAAPAAKQGGQKSAPPDKSAEDNESTRAREDHHRAEGPITEAVAAATVATDPTVVGPVDRGEGDHPVAKKRKRPTSERVDTVDTGRRKGRRVRRVIRRIDLWSVLKLAIVLYTCLYAAVMATLALLWGRAYSSGQIEKVQSFLASVGMDNYRFYGDQMWRACAMIGAIGVLAATVITVLTAALVNVISEMTGGIRVIVIEEDPPPRRR